MPGVKYVSFTADNMQIIFTSSTHFNSSFRYPAPQEQEPEPYNEDPSILYILQPDEPEDPFEEPEPGPMANEPGYYLRVIVYGLRSVGALK